MQRAAVLWRASPARLLIALFALLLASALAVATGANFNSTSSNPGNAVTAGIISHTNSKPGAVVLNITKLMPGVPQTGTVKLTNTGDNASKLTLKASNLSSPPGANGGVLANQLDLNIKRNGTSVWTGKLKDLDTLDLGAWNAGQVSDFDFVVQLPDTAPNGADNAYQGAGASVDLSWESVS